jgi:hypothetical protein
VEKDLAEELEKEKKQAESSEELNKAS